jgi:putative PIN family toxin of toxin-antitoxin system
VGNAPEKVVLDTNVLLSAMLFGGKPAELVEAARLERIRAVTSLYILQEFQDVLLSLKFGFQRNLCEALAVELTDFMEVAPVLVARRRWTADPNDDPIVETALQAGATIVVTGDKRLLEAEVPGLSVVTVAEMVDRLRG